MTVVSEVERMSSHCSSVCMVGGKGRTEGVIETAYLYLCAILLSVW